MVYVLAAVIAVLAFCVAVLLATQVELLREMRQVRELTGLLDRPAPLDLGTLAGQPPQSANLPALSAAANGLFLILSDRCATCRSLAQALDGAVPSELTIILSNPGGRDSELPTTWDLGPRTVNDEDNRISKALDTKITPAAVLVRDGRLLRAQSVPSTRQLYALLDEVRSASSVSRGLALSHVHTEEAVK